MRIIGGKHRGRKLAEFTVSGIRPTSDRAKESLFNILSFKIVGAKVLDLFCGSGSLGLESISRGAAHVHFNDLSKESLAVLKKNVAAIGEGDKCGVSESDYLNYLNRTQDKFDIIFIDPPYAMEYGVPALETIAKRGLLSGDGVAVYERDRSFDGEIEGLEKYDERKYGKAYLTFFRYSEVK
ncbi:MAG: 16S rRNA (guanine(966)-N(2))-methyltransferase RsmD [Clostridia bacterium]|nr:16S rRNA (guanine(966)-N(2))-methyltransferase RsmD [Clostridia bacterium]